jgi:hypothetical protein
MEDDFTGDDKGDHTSFPGSEWFHRYKALKPGMERKVGGHLEDGTFHVVAEVTLERHELQEKAEVDVEEVKKFVKEMEEVLEMVPDPPLPNSRPIGGRLQETRWMWGGD